MKFFFFLALLLSVLVVAQASLAHNDGDKPEHVVKAHEAAEKTAVSSTHKDKAQGGAKKAKSANDVVSAMKEKVKEDSKQKVTKSKVAEKKVADKKAAKPAEKQSKPAEKQSKSAEKSKPAEKKVVNAKAHKAGKKAGKKSGANKPKAPKNLNFAKHKNQKKQNAHLKNEEESKDNQTVAYGPCSGCLNGGSGECVDRAKVCWTLYDDCPPNTLRCYADGSHPAFPSLDPHPFYVSEVKKETETKRSHHSSSSTMDPSTQQAKNMTEMLYVYPHFECTPCALGSALGHEWVCQNSRSVCFPKNKYTEECPAQTKDCGDYLKPQEDETDDY